MFRLAQKLGVIQHFLCGADHIQVNAVYLCTSQTLLQRRRRNEANPGLDKRLSLFGEHDDNNFMSDVTDSIDEDSLQDDIVNFDIKSVNANHNRKTDHERDKLKHHIIKQKYFKTEKLPNFLTWAEKEQIRQLHSSDTLEWSTEKLSQSFPAPETVIKKIIKSRWAQEDLNNILRHDKSVQKNWTDLIKGRLEIDTQLKNHLMKFAKRKQAELSHTFLKNANYSENVIAPVENVEGEFSNMVKLCRGEIGSSKQLTISAPLGDEISSERSSKGSYSKDSDTFLLDSDAAKPGKAKKLVTLSQYKQTFSLDGVDIEESVASPHESTLQISHDKTDERPVSLTRKESQLVPKVEKSSISLQYPEWIPIPKNKWKKGGTYKAGDCYYDDDGKFLYRVPGMG